MGQKVNPTGFRIGVNQDWQTVAYSPKSDYAKSLVREAKVRDYILLNMKTAGVVSINIKRVMQKILIEIEVSRPGLVIGKGGAGIEKIKKELSRITQTKQIEIKLFEAKQSEGSAKLIAESISLQLSKRIVPKFAVNRELENIKKAQNVKGVRIAVSGRIKGAEIARTEKFQWGSVPLQTLRSDIDYYYMPISVPNAGIHGVKVWVYKGEKLGI